jgi:hypothetical protein
MLAHFRRSRRPDSEGRSIAARNFRIKASNSLTPEAQAASSRWRAMSAQAPRSSRDGRFRAAKPIFGGEFCRRRCQTRLKWRQSEIHLLANIRPRPTSFARTGMPVGKKDRVANDFEKGSLDKQMETNARHSA